MKYTNKLWRLVYPTRCPVCDRIVAPYGAKICFLCRKKLRIIREPYCLKCGKSLEKNEQEYCHDCSGREHVFIRGAALYEYESIYESLYRFKYGKRSEYAEFYGEEIARILGDRIRSWNADALVPVPIHKKRLRERGYNQALLLAEQVGRHLGLPVYGKMIRRVQNTRPQKELGPKERQNNLKRAFKLYENDVKLDTIIIIDDIYTTGSTIDAVGKVLMEAGAKRIYFVTLSIGKGL